MEIKKQLSVPAQFFYERVIDSVKFDIKQATGRTLTDEQLAGFEYVKEFSPRSKAKIHIQDVDPGKKYQFATKTNKNSFIATYQVKSIDEKMCEVIYEEQMISHGTLQSMNDMFVGTILGYFKKRQFKRMLTMIEKTY